MTLNDVSASHFVTRSQNASAPALLIISICPVSVSPAFFLTWPYPPSFSPPPLFYRSSTAPRRAVRYQCSSMGVHPFVCCKRKQAFLRPLHAFLFHHPPSYVALAIWSPRPHTIPLYELSCLPECRFPTLFRTHLCLIWKMSCCAHDILSPSYFACVSLALSPWPFEFPNDVAQRNAAFIALAWLSTTLLLASHSRSSLHFDTYLFPATYTSPLRALCELCRNVITIFIRIPVTANIVPYTILSSSLL